MAQQIKDSELGVKLGNIDSNEMQILSILLYADNIVCLANSEIDLQAILVIIEEWCQKWRLEVNLTKTNIMHVRRNESDSPNLCLSSTTDPSHIV